MQKQELLQKQKRDSLLQELVKEKSKAKAREELRKLAVFLGLFSAAVAGRIALQWIPSVEPIIPLAIAAGLIFGAKEGFTLGGSAYIVSNFFVWGLQGPWTIFQALGAALPGGFAGVYGKLKEVKSRDLVFLTVVGTIFFEVMMNVSGALMGIGLLGAFSLLALPLYFVTSLPFSLVHIGSNAVFAKAFSPLLKLRRKKNEFKVISFTRIAAGKRSTVRLYKSEQ
jgi:hypothetical protein